MTLRVSFHKLLIETLRRHLAAVLITVLAFFVHIISFFLNVQNILNQEYVQDIASSSFYPSPKTSDYVIRELTSLSSPNFATAIMAMLIGVYLAFDFFRYMHSKRETDFYESMPIRRQKWFLTLLTASVGLFLVLAILTVGIELAIVYSIGYGSKLMLQGMLWNLLCMLGTFLVCWVTTVLAMVMTGHPIIAFLGFGIFASYIPLIIGNLIPVYAATFLKTYVYEELNPVYYYFSPITLAYKVSHNYSLWNIDEHWTYLLGCFIFAITVGFLAYLLFLRRPSESAGRAMAFEKINSLIRILIVIPLALYAGLFLNEITSVDSTVWLIFGVIFAAGLIHGIMEAIFQFDIKAIISKKRQLLFTILFCLAFVFVFWADLFRFDQYVPDAKDVKSVKIDTYLFDQNGKYPNEWKNGLSGEYVDDALAAIKDIRECMEPSDSEDYNYMNDFEVIYELKNGVKRKRYYPYYGNEFPESLDKLSATEEFKDDFCILYHLDKVDITSISVFNGAETFSLHLTDEQRKEFGEIYRKEYTKLTFSESLSKEAIYKLIVSYPLDGEDYDVSAEYNIYSDFTETLAYLEKYNVVSFKNAQNIKLMNLEIYSDNRYVNDEEQLNALKEYMLLGEFMYHRYYSEDYEYCNLRYVLNGSTRYMDVYLKTTDISKVLNNN